MAFATLSVSTDGPVTVIALNRPEKANTLSTRMLIELVDVQVMIAADPSVRAVVVTGAGRHFCGGADLADDEPLPAGVRIGFERLPQPVIAAVNGGAVGGGCELALACDYRIVAEDGFFSLPETQFGELPFGGGTTRLPRLVGPSLAKRLIWTGERVHAERAVQIGLADEVSPSAGVLSAAKELGRVISERPAYAIHAVKFLIDRGAESPLETALQVEKTVAATMATPAQREEARRQAAARNPVYARIFGYEEVS
ncbi:enoyl-CoA hydratase-related protein [Nonomuraea sp. NPDC026600]|uniref:enoyl-CoA hydratase/isomerase family protein n=1 Tax=Nonomuraea sp. NPDC026600 TaxID=3155363 RepID=UPI0033C9BAAD